GSPEKDVARYLLFRATSEVDAFDVRSMQQVATVASKPSDVVSADIGIPTVVPGKPGWLEYAVESIPSELAYFRLVAVDEVGNWSKPSALLSGRSIRATPDPPQLASPKWNATHSSVALTWTSPDARLSSLVERRLTGTSEWTPVSAWLPRGLYTLTD